LSRGLAVLELLGGADGGYPLSEVAHRLRLPAGTTHRLLRSLVQSGWVEQDLRSRRYQLGLKVLDVRGATIPALRLAAQARSALRDLMLDAGLRAHLAVYRAGAIVYVDRVDTPASAAPYVALGARKPAHATSLGKALLAFGAPAEARAYVAQGRLAPFTPATITDPAAFERELAAIRRRGYAVDGGEFDHDAHCVGAPIRDATGRTVAALSVAGAPEEIAPRLAELAALVRATARDISRQLGYRAAPAPRAAGLAGAAPVEDG
jgi:IclR family acetate operon transcriptional repressor